MTVLDTRTRADDAEFDRLVAELTAELAAELTAELAERCADLPPPALVNWPGQPRLGLHGETPWWVGAAEDDPMRDRRGRLPVPREARERLQELAARGLPFRRIAVAHELDPAGPVRDLLPVLRLGSIACTAETARLLVGPPPPHPGVQRAVRLLERLVGDASDAAGRVTAAVLDPIVFGVVAPHEPRPGDATLWFPLVDWRW